jgi:hypothetical protein
VTVTQNSTRPQQSASPITCDAGHEPFSSSKFASSPQRPASSFQILIANPRLKSTLSTNGPNQLQISNRERMAFCRLTPRFYPPGAGLVVPLFSSSLQPPASSLQNPPSGGRLIVTPRLEFPATPTKQNSNPISYRYKSPFFALLSRSSPSLAWPAEAEGRRRASLAPTSRKAIMSRNHFTQFPRSKPLMRKVTNADANQS